MYQTTEEWALEEGDYQSYNKLAFRVMAVNVQGLLTKSTTTHHNNMKHSGKGN